VTSPGSPPERAPGWWLEQGSDRTELIEELATSSGERVGLDGLLACPDLGLDVVPGRHRAVPVRPPAPAASFGFRWRLLDEVTLRWWPQGITTSADANNDGAVGGREIVVVSWYSKQFPGGSRGVRLSVVDVTDRTRPTYQHVLLVEPVRNDHTGVVEPRLVHGHAGGIIWYGSSIWVAETYGGFRLFDVGDVMRLGGDEVAGYEYVLPQRTSYDSVTEPGGQRFRFSFISLDRSGSVPRLLTGEYGTAAASRRVARFLLEPGSGGLACTDAGGARTAEVLADGPARMQGVVAVEGREYMSTSNGRWHRGDLWTREPLESPKNLGPALAVGPEDLAYWPHHDELWNLSEHPLRRYVYALPRSSLQ
jgi:hypothetical protein